ncbi:MAG: hypothetical protein K6T75_05780 [Acetobacteraceae bacterium]|nr:hypothetical protein [Acetobacteraceae bacterium]
MTAVPDRVEQAGTDRGLDVGPLVQRLLALIPRRREVERRLVELGALRRRASKEPPGLPSGAVEGGGAPGRARGAGWGSRAELTALRALLRELRAEERGLLLSLPNLPAPGVPGGRDRAHDRELRRGGPPPRAPATARPHWEVAAALGWCAAGAWPRRGTPGLSGGVRAPAPARGAGLLDEGPALLRGLAGFLLSFHRQRGYQEVTVPSLVQEEELVASGHLPHYRQGMYRLAEGGGWLAPSLEPGMLGRLRGRALDARDLPLAWVACGPCFRARAGAGGRQERGLVRLHQFHEVRLLRVVCPEAAAPGGGAEELEGEVGPLLGHVEEALRRLELPYRVVLRCSGRLSFAAALTCDLEVLMPSRGEYLALSSCRAYGDFQARRAGIRVGEGRGHGRTRFAHTLSASALPLERCLAALLENHQQEDGSVLVPQALRPFWGGAGVLEPLEWARP